MSRRILIADESAPLLRSLKQLLEDYCVEWTVCAQAGDGLEAIEKTMQSLPDLVILSAALPRLSGMSAAMAIRERLPDVPILMLSLRASAELAAAAIGRDVCQVVPKADPLRIVKAVQGLLGGSRESPQAAKSSRG